MREQATVTVLLAGSKTCQYGIGEVRAKPILDTPQVGTQNFKISSASDLQANAEFAHQKFNDRRFSVPTTFLSARPLSLSLESTSATPSTTEYLPCVGLHWSNALGKMNMSSSW